MKMTVVIKSNRWNPRENILNICEGREVQVFHLHQMEVSKQGIFTDW